MQWMRLIPEKRKGRPSKRRATETSCPPATNFPKKGTKGVNRKEGIFYLTWILVQFWMIPNLSRRILGPRTCLDEAPNFSHRGFVVEACTKVAPSGSFFSF